MIQTKADKITRKLHVWAVPKYHIKEGEDPFSYELTLCSVNYGNDTAIHLMETEVVIDLPEGIDLYSRAVETLNIRARDLLKDYTTKLQEIEQQRKQLLRLTSDNSDVVAES